MSQRGKSSPVGPRVSVCTEPAQKDRDKDRTGPRSSGRALAPFVAAGGTLGAHDDLAGGPGAASGDAPSFLLVPQPNPWAWGERETVPLVLGSVLVQEDTRQPWQDPTPLCPCSAVSARGGISGIQQARPRWSSAPQTNLAPANATPGGSSRLQRHAFHSCTPIPRSPRNVPPQDSRLSAEPTAKANSAAPEPNPTGAVSWVSGSLELARGRGLGSQGEGTGRPRPRAHPGETRPRVPAHDAGCYGNGPSPHYFVASTGSGAVPK